MSGFPQRIQKLFYQGNYAGVLALTVNSPVRNYSRLATPWIVGALSFQGRMEEAESFFRHHASQLSFEAGCEACFYLAVGFTRQSQYSRARSYLLRDLKLRLRHRNLKVKFFASQGLGFYRYFHGRFRVAQKHAARAFQSATFAKFLFGKSFGAELFGHSLVQLGEVSLGLKYITDGIEFAKMLGDGGLQWSFTISLVCYQVRFGIHPATAFKRLLQLTRNAAVSDSYSMAGLHLELSRQYLMRGDAEKAKEALDVVCPAIYSSKHRRFGALLNLRYAAIHFARGEYTTGLMMVQNALYEIDEKVDQALATEARGQQIKFLEQLGVFAELPNIKIKVEKLTGFTGQAVGRRILNRKKLLSGCSQRMGDDPLGNFLDLAQQDRTSAIQQALRSNYLGFLSEWLGIDRAKPTLYFGPSLGQLILLDRGNIKFNPNGASRLIRALAQQLVLGEKTKRQLISELWGYVYHPLKHDPLLYRLVSRFRQALGDNAHWLQATDRGYCFRGDVQIIFGNETKGLEFTKPEKRTGSSELELNFRQIQILRKLLKQEFIDVRTCKQMLQISEMTARRDLVGLMSLNQVRRLGKGRAVRYTLSG